jgi:hypothetical protein
MSLSAINIVLSAVTDLFNKNVKKAADTMEKASGEMQASATKAGQAIEQSLGSGQLRQKIASVTAEIEEQKQITREFQADLEKLRQRRDTMSKMDVQGQKEVRKQIEQTKTALKDQSLAVAELTAKKQGYTQQLGQTNQSLSSTRAALNGLATSFSSVSSIIAIVADDNKALRNTLMGLNAALNFSAAVLQVKDLQEQFGGLTKFLTNPWVLATIAIGATAAAIYAYSNSVSTAQQIQREVNDELLKSTEAARANAVSLNGYLAIVNDVTQSENVRLGALEQLKKLGVAIDGINIKSSQSLSELNRRVRENINLSIQKAIADKAAAKIAEIEMDRIEKVNKIRQEGGSILGKMREKFLPGYIAVINEVNDANDEAAAKTDLYTQAFKNAAIQVANYTDLETAARKESIKVSQKNAKEKEKEAESIAKSAESVKKAQQDLTDWLDKKSFEIGQKAKKRAAEEAKALTGANLIAGTAIAPILVQVKIDPKSYSQIVQDFDKLMTDMSAAVEQLAENITITLGETLGNALSGQGNGIEGFVQSVVGQLGDFVKTVGKMLIAYGISVEKFQAAFVNPAAAVVAGIAMVALGTAVSNQIKTGPSVQAFADGGIVSGPTLGLMGEYPGARSNPEVIAPLDKLKTLMKSDQSTGYVAQTHISGRDLAIVLERYNKDSRRG